MGRVCMSVIALFVSYGLAAASPVMAQPPNSWGSLVGNWKLEFLSKERTPLAHGVFAFHPGPFNRYAGGLIMDAPGAYKPYSCQGGLKGGKVELACGTYGFLTHFDYLTLEPSANGNALNGTWRWTAKEPEGFVRATRAGSPTIEKVEVVSLNGSGSNNLRIRVYGRALPNWIGMTITEDSVDKRVFRHELWAWSHISIDDPTFRIRPSSYAMMSAAWSQNHLDVIVRLEPGARPGRKTITINGASKTFDANFRNAREASKVVELKFVRKDGSEVKEIGYGEPFHVEARFDLPSPERERMVKLEWPGGGREIPVVRQPGEKVFRSGLLYLEAPTDATRKQ
ncbi:MAG TPA: hypothetical protein VMO26_07445 [Vicinamibacterales bacterium]|nr:hypothetical protein [Vicinamibacterales bacterium]